MQMGICFHDSFSRGVALDWSTYRRRTFSVMRGRAAQQKGIQDFDPFDRDDAWYVLALDEDGCIDGWARLLPTTAPYLLAARFPQLLNGLAPPCSPEIWELSRFAAVDLERAAASPLGPCASPVAEGLLRAAVSTAAEQGAKHVITVSTLGIERLLRHAGFRSHRTGPPVMSDGHPLFACWIPLV